MKSTQEGYFQSRCLVVVRGEKGAKKKERCYGYPFFSFSESFGVTIRVARVTAVTCRDSQGPTEWCPPFVMRPLDSLDAFSDCPCEEEGILQVERSFRIQYRTTGNRDAISPIFTEQFSAASRNLKGMELLFS